MEQFKHFPHKWSLGVNDIIRFICIFVRYFSLLFFSLEDLRLQPACFVLEAKKCLVCKARKLDVNKKEKQQTAFPASVTMVQVFRLM